MSAPRPGEAPPITFVATFTEDDFENLIGFASNERAKGYADGFGEGAGKYGGTGCAYVLPADEDEMRANESKDALEAYAKAMDRMRPSPVRGMGRQSIAPDSTEK